MVGAVTPARAGRITSVALTIEGVLGTTSATIIEKEEASIVAVVPDCTDAARVKVIVCP